jgi:proteasome lid subunit RPN8/RPN11
VRGFLPARDAASNVASLTIDHDVWAQLHRTLQQGFPDSILLGWQHTHPGHGVFLSGYDRFIHRNYFDQAWHVAMVVDPKRQEFCFYQWHEDEIIECGFVCVSAKQQNAN